jgi:predicted nuclease with TOPRIM domain
MEDKVLDLIEKMYIELKQGQDEMRKDIKGLGNQQDEMRKDIKGLGSQQDEMTKDIQSLSNQMVRFENGMKEDIKALYDGYRLTYEKVQEIDKKVEKQEVEIKVIQGGKK